MIFLDSQLKLREINQHMVGTPRIYVIGGMSSVPLGPETLLFTLDSDIEKFVWPLLLAVDIHGALYDLTRIVHLFVEFHVDPDM